MTSAATGDKASSRNERMAPAYAPSWVDRFNAWVAQLPGPSWSYYLGIGLVVFLLQTAVLWGEGAYPIGALLPVQGFLAVMAPFWLALIHYLDHKAAAALTTLRPALQASEREYSGLRFQLTTLPARPTLLASLVGATFIVLLSEGRGYPVSFDPLATALISAVLTKCVYIILFSFFFVFMYHTVHQMRVINLIYTKYTRVNLFTVSPLYALSSVTAITAGSMTAATYAWYAINDLSAMLGDPIALGIAFAIAVLAFAAFIWPQLGIHRLQTAEKERMLGEANQRFEAIIAELHQRVDEGKLEGVADLNTAMAGLEMEKNALRGMPTWPWDPETVRLLITAVALPLGLWIVQYVLQRVLGL